MIASWGPHTGPPPTPYFSPQTLQNEECRKNPPSWEPWGQSGHLSLLPVVACPSEEIRQFVSHRQLTLAADTGGTVRTLGANQSRGKEEVLLLTASSPNNYSLLSFSDKQIFSGGNISVLNVLGHSNFSCEIPEISWPWVQACTKSPRVLCPGYLTSPFSFSNHIQQAATPLISLTHTYAVIAFIQ